MTWDQMKAWCQAKAEEKSSTRFFFQKHNTAAVCGLVNNDNNTAPKFNNHTSGGICTLGNLPVKTKQPTKQPTKKPTKKPTQQPVSSSSGVCVCVDKIHKKQIFALPNF